MSGPDSSNGKSIRHEFEGWRFESKIKAAARTELTFKQLALLQKYFCIFVLTVRYQVYYNYYNTYTTLLAFCFSRSIMLSLLIDDMQLGV